jgi:hypothetical protein
MEHEVVTLLDVLGEIKRRGYFARDAWDWFEIEEISDFEDYETILHNDIPGVIVDIARSANVSIYNIYHLKDDVKMPEYIVLLEWDGEEYTLELDVIMEDDACTVFIVGGEKGWVEIPPYYHPVYLL